MNAERFGEELRQGEEWKPRGIVGPIQPGAGNGEGTKRPELPRRKTELRLLL